MKPAEHAPARQSLQRVWARDPRTFLALLVLALAGCAPWRLPVPTPRPTDPRVAPANTVTIAPVLLTPVPTETPPPASLILSASRTPTFGLPLPKRTCFSTPMWGLGEVWKNEDVRLRLGCPSNEQVGVQGEEMYFQNGHMLWRPDTGLIYVLFNAERAEGWGAFADESEPTDLDNDPNIVAPTPASGGTLYVQPTGRFGKLWRENSWLHARLGWAVPQYVNGRATSLIRFQGAAQDFESGTLFWNGNVCFVLRTDDMSWTMY